MGLKMEIRAVRRSSVPDHAAEACIAKPTFGCGEKITMLRGNLLVGHEAKSYHRPSMIGAKNARSSNFNIVSRAIPPFHFCRSLLLRVGY